MENIKELLSHYEMNTTISGMGAMEYMARLIERNDNLETDVERSKIDVSVLKQMNNRSRMILDAVKTHLKEQEMELRFKAAELAQT